MFIRSERPWLATIAAGLVGAGVLMWVRGPGASRSRAARRIDRIESALLTRGRRRAGLRTLHGRSRARWNRLALLLADAVFFSTLVAARPRGFIRRSIASGVIASTVLSELAAVPRRGWRRVARDVETDALTAGIYAVGGVASAAASRLLAPASL